MDSLKLLLENLRFFSESNLNAISVRATSEWTIYISLLTFFIGISGVSLKLKKNFPKKSLIATICTIAVLGCGFFLSIHCAYYKNQQIYLQANKQIVSSLKKYKLIISEDTAKLSPHSYFNPKYPWLGRFSVVGLQMMCILIFAGMAVFIISRNEGKKNNSDLLKNKKASGRPQDIADLEELKKVKK